MLLDLCQPDTSVHSVLYGLDRVGGSIKKLPRKGPVMESNVGPVAMAGSKGSTATPTPTPINHRTRVGQERRAKTKSKIIEAALRVFAEKGPDAPVIDDFINAAGIARGTFYNYYKSVDELLGATSKWLGDDAVRSIEAAIGESKDPVHRLADGIRLWMKKSEADPEW